ncbi:MAG: TetR/AcrR family transcriptional regulator [Gemmatimonadaceae bacterium]
MRSSSRGTDAPPISSGRERQKGRTQKALLAAALKLMADGQTPSITEVADAAEVSRRTAYRYFPTQEQLLVEAALEGLRPIMVQAVEDTEGTDPADIEARLDRAVRALQRGAVANEPLLRTVIRLTVGTPAPTRPTERTTPRRGYRRIDWITLALEPVRAYLGKRRFDRLVAALTVCVGIDALIVLRDLCGMSEVEAENVTRWTARALLRESLSEAEAGTVRR